MKTKLPLLLALLFLAGAVNAQTGGIGPGPRGSGISAGPATWSRYTVKDEEFSVSLPVRPSLNTRKVPHSGTDKDRVVRVLHAAEGPVEYLIYIFENPKPRQSLEDFIRQQTADTNHDFVNERTLSVDGCAGKEYSYRVNDKPRIEQFFTAEKRLYRFVASGAPAEHDGVHYFFKSLSFGDEREGLVVSEGPAEVLTEDSERYYLGREVSTKARLIAKPDPSYTATAKQHQVIGTVILKVVFAANGKVTNLRVVQGLPHGLTERCVEAAKKIKFVPATKDGKPVSMWMQLEYNFNLY